MQHAVSSYLLYIHASNEAKVDRQQRQPYQLLYSVQAVQAELIIIIHGNSTADMLELLALSLAQWFGTPSKNSNKTSLLCI